MSKLPRLKVFQNLWVVSLSCALAAALIYSWRWPLVGDASLMHYVIFLIHRGWVPYKQIVDINLPGSYFFEALSMRLFGGGALGLRIYDLLLLGACGASAFAILPRNDRFAALFAAGLFSLLHIQDGMAQLGQRDLLITALLAVAYALLLSARSISLSPFVYLLSGLLVGTTLVVKPLYLPFGLLLVAATVFELRHLPKIALGRSALVMTGLAVPIVCTLAYLQHDQALDAFGQTLTGLIPLHASLGHRSASYLLSRCLSRVGPLCAAWAIVLAVTRIRLSLERVLLVFGAVLSLLGDFAQRKGLPYHRYPFLFFLLVLIAWDLLEATRRNGLGRYTALVGISLGCFFLAPQAAWKIHSFETATPFQSALAHELTDLGGQKLSGHIQCLDTFGGCINTLYDLKIVQSSGFLYDCYLFTPSQGKVTANYRDAFWKAYQANPPNVIVMTSQFCFGPDGFGKLHNWVAFEEELDRSYKLKTEWVPRQPQHWWSRREYPASFRIYLRNAMPGGN